MTTSKLSTKLNNKKFLIFGYGLAATHFLNKIFSLGIKKDDVYLITHDNTQLNKQLYEYIKFHKIRFSIYEKENFFKKIKKFNPDYVFSIYFRKKVSAKILELVNYKAINLHPSYLPNYRGAFSIPWMIYNGEKFAGFTYHYMNDKFDKGDIIFQKKVKIDKEETSFSLYNKLIIASINNFEKVIDRILLKKKTKQKPNGSYFSRIMPKNCEIRLTNKHNDNLKILRASYFPPFKPSFLKVGKKVVYFDTIKKYKDYVRKLKI